MADPFSAGTMAAVGLASSAGGGILSAFGQSQQGEAKASELRYKAGVARVNAEIERQNSDWSLTVGERESMRSGLTTGFTIAKQKVVQSGSGFDVNSGTAEAVRESTRLIGLDDQSTIRTNYGRKAQAHRQMGNNLDAEAAGLEAGAKNVQKASRMSALSTLIGTAGSVATRWTRASQSFGWGPSGSGSFHNSGDSVDYA